MHINESFSAAVSNRGSLCDTNPPTSARTNVSVMQVELEELRGTLKRVAMESVSLLGEVEQLRGDKTKLMMEVQTLEQEVKYWRDHSAELDLQAKSNRISADSYQLENNKLQSQIDVHRTKEFQLLRVREQLEADLFTADAERIKDKQRLVILDEEVARHKLLRENTLWFFDLAMNNEDYKHFVVLASRANEASLKRELIDLTFELKTQRQANDGRTIAMIEHANGRLDALMMNLNRVQRRITNDAERLEHEAPFLQAFCAALTDVATTAKVLNSHDMTIMLADAEEQRLAPAGRSADRSGAWGSGRGISSSTAASGGVGRASSDRGDSPHVGSRFSQADGGLFAGLRQSFKGII